MMKVLYILLFPFLFWSCSVSEHFSKSQKKLLTGKWTEKWIGVDTDVDEIDTLKISFVRRHLSIEDLSDSAVIYDSIFLRKDVLSFRLERPSEHGESFFVYYTLKLDLQKKISELLGVPILPAEKNE